jgi:hypothetical protein
MLKNKTEWAVVRRRLRSPGNAGRDYLWTFTRHWLSALIMKYRPALATKVSSSYKVSRS